MTRKKLTGITHEDIRQLVLLTRKNNNLPIDDVECLYKILTEAPFGLSLRQVCVCLGLHPQDWKTAWGVIHDMQQRYKIKKLSRWTNKGGGMAFIALPETTVGDYYQDISAYISTFVKDGMLTAPPRPRPHRPQPVYPKDLARLPDEFTRNDAVQIFSITRAAVTNKINRWVDQGYVEVVSDGCQGRGYAYVYAKIPHLAQKNDMQPK